MKVGIDLGTTYSLIATVRPNGLPLLLPDHTDKTLVHTPSSVYVAANGAFVGHMAEALHSQHPEFQVIRFFKRHFGANKPIFFDERGQGWFPETIAALLLKKLRADAEAALSTDVQSAVITVPAHFNDRQRKAVLAAAALADLPVLGLADEPVVAALHYGVKSSSHEQLLVVYDLGGGTFDVTILTLDSKGVYVLGKEGLTDLGGKEFDEKIATIILTQFEHALGYAPSLNAQSLQQLRKVAEELKIELCLPGCEGVRRMVLLAPMRSRCRSLAVSSRLLSCPTSSRPSRCCCAVWTASA
jgi:molecular chaperone DnaK (HSP70)